MKPRLLALALAALVAAPALAAPAADPWHTRARDLLEKAVNIPTVQGRERMPELVAGGGLPPLHAPGGIGQALEAGTQRVRSESPEGDTQEPQRARGRQRDPIRGHFKGERPRRPAAAAAAGSVS